MIEEPSEDQMDDVNENSVYNLEYYTSKNLPSLQNDAHTTITHTQTPDGMNQTIYASIYRPSNVVKTKLFACGADAHPGYVDNVLTMLWMKWQDPYEESPWSYPCYPNC